MGLVRWIANAALLIAISATVADAAGSRPGASFHDYGPSVGQALDLYRPEGKRPAPLLLFIHGGGWSAGAKAMGEGIQPAYFTRQGFAWASMGYRLVPRVTVEEQAADVARAIGWLLQRAKRFNLEPDGVILIGHSSGAHLAALVATDPQWLKAAGVPFTAIRGVISLDGAGIDVPGIMAMGAAGSPFYANAFGSDVARQTRLSPQAHIGAPDAPRWLFVYDQYHNPPAGLFAERFAEAARPAGAEVRVVPIADTTHMRMLNELGTPGDPVTAAVDQFLSETLRPPPPAASPK